MLRMVIKPYLVTRESYLVEKKDLKRAREFYEIRATNNERRFSE